MLKSLFRTRGQRVSDGSVVAVGRSRRRRGTTFRLGMESLEGRSLLSTVTVHVVDDAFNPDPVTIHLGDTVEWVWDGGPHSTTSVKGEAESWDSGLHNVGFTFDHTFTHAGSFAYYCTLHGVDNGNGTAGGMSGMINVVSTSATLQSIAVTPADPSVPVGTTRQFVAMGTYSDGTTQDLTSQVTWASATPSIATVSNTGLARSLAAGSSAITASLDGITGSTLLTIVAPTPSPAPTLTGEKRLFVGRGHRRKIDGFMLFFSAPLDAGIAKDVSLYQVTQQGRTGHSRPVIVPAQSAFFNPADNSVMIMLGPLNARNRLTLTATGLMGAGGIPVATFATRL